jgi:hypothetical protein
LLALFRAILSAQAKNRGLVLGEFFTTKVAEPILAIILLSLRFRVCHFIHSSSFDLETVCSNGTKSRILPAIYLTASSRKRKLRVHFAPLSKLMQYRRDTFRLCLLPGGTWNGRRGQFAKKYMWVVLFLESSSRTVAVSLCLILKIATEKSSLERLVNLR